MANRLIGIEQGPEVARIAVLQRDRRGVVVVALEECRGDTAEQMAAIARLTAGVASFGDRVAAMLPAAAAFSRTLHFPFTDRRKITAAAPLELAAQLPVSPDDCQTFLYWPSTADAGEVVAAAVPCATIGDFLDPFDQAGIPLHIVDLAPYGLAAGLADRIGTGILIYANGQETLLALILDRELVEHRVWPGDLHTQGERSVEQLLRECRLIRHRRGLPDLPCYLFGSGITPELTAKLEAQALRGEILHLGLDGRTITPAFVPAVALALRAAAAPERSFNLRQGAFAFRGESGALKKQLVIAACLLALICLTLAASATLQYRSKARQVDQIEQQMVRLYQDSFPGSQPTVDVPLHMASKLRELRDQAVALGIAGPSSPLAVLRLLAELPAQGRFEVEELVTGDREIRLSGHTDTFETVNRIKDHLGKSPLFRSVEVAEAKKSLDGSRVDVRLTLPLTAGEVTP